MKDYDCVVEREKYDGDLSHRIPRKRKRERIVDDYEGAKLQAISCLSTFLGFVHPRRNAASRFKFLKQRRDNVKASYSSNQLERFNGPIANGHQENR